MRHPFKILFCMVLTLSLAGFLGGCGKPSVPAKRQMVNNTSRPAAKVAAKAQGEKEQEEKPVVYDYEARGRRDPFTSLIAIAKEKQKRKKTSNPLENFSVDEIRVTAIVWDANGSFALITLPDNKSYTIRQGMTLGQHGGKVVKITNDSVMVKEQIRDYRGQLITKDTTLKLREEGER